MVLIPSWESASRSAAEEFPNIYGTQKLITCPQEPSIGPYSEPDQSSRYQPPNPISLRFILILSSNPCLGLLSFLFPSDYPTETLYTLLVSPACASFNAHFSFFTWSF
jgi:hypothetical protein